MKKIIAVLFLFCIAKTCFCQTINISGDTKNRLLVWDDFSGKPDKDSPHDANTHWSIKYTVTGVSFKGDTATFKGLTVPLEFDNKLSWVKKGKQTATLLKHEQGHFDIAVLCQQELIKQINTTIFLKPNFQEQLRNLFKTILEKYHAMGVQYDEETNHSKDVANQNKWNDFLTKTLSE